MISYEEKGKECKARVVIQDPVNYFFVKRGQIGTVAYRIMDDGLNKGMLCVRWSEESTFLVMSDEIEMEKPTE